MPTITAEQVKQYTDAISIELKSDKPAKLVEALLIFGEFLSEQFPDKNNEEIQKALKKSGIIFDHYILAELDLVKLGAMNGIATTYYSDREDRSDEMLVNGDDSLFRTYKAWKIATVVFAYFVGESSKGDLFSGLQVKVRDKSDEWAPLVSSQVDNLVADKSLKIIRLQEIFKQYQELIIAEVKQAVLALPRAQLVLLQDKKGNLDIQKILEITDNDMSNYPKLLQARVEYLAINTLNDTLIDKNKNFSARLDHFNTLAKNTHLKEILTSTPAKKSLWDSFLNTIRAVRISGTKGFFQANKKMQINTELNQVLSSSPKTK